MGIDSCLSKSVLVVATWRLGLALLGWAWAVLCWIGQGRVGLCWASLGWAGLGSLGLDWVGPGWPVLCWVLGWAALGLG